MVVWEHAIARGYDPYGTRDVGTYEGTAALTTRCARQLGIAARTVYRYRRTTVRWRPLHGPPVSASPAPTVHARRMALHLSGEEDYEPHARLAQDIAAEGVSAANHYIAGEALF